MPQDKQLNSSRVSTTKWLLAVSLLLALAVPMITGSLMSWHSLGELDVWLHQKAGQTIIEGNGFPRLNSYSYTEPDHPWTNHEWLFQVLVAATGPGPDDLESGINRWIILRLLLILLLLAILLMGDHPWRAPPLRLIWMAPGIFLGVFLLWTRVLLRPELVSYALMILMVRLAESPTREPWSLRQLVSPRTREGQAFGVTLLWAQFHGFSALAPVIWLLAGLLGFLPRSSFPRTALKRLVAGTGLLMFALMLTPNGWQGFIYPLMAVGQFSSSKIDLHATISELQPLLQTTDGLHYTIILFQISLIWGLVHTIVTWPRRNLLRTALWVLAAAATLIAQRNIGIYAITFVLLHTNTRHHQYWNFRAVSEKFRIPSASAALPALMILLATSLFWPALLNDDFYLAEGQSRRFGSGPTVSRYPFQAAAILAATPGTKVFANVDAASLTLSRGKSKVFIDGRTEAYSPETWYLYHQLRLAGPGALKVLDQSGTKTVLLTLGGGSFHPLLRTLLDSPHWIVRHADASGVLMQHQRDSIDSRNLASFAKLQPLTAGLQKSSAREADALAAQGTFLILAGKTDEGVLSYRQGLKLRPDHPQLNHNLGNQLMNSGLTSQALKHFQQALETNPRLRKSAMNAGVCLMKSGDFSGAEEMFAKAIKLQPSNFQGWVNRSLALQQLGRHGEACRAMEKAVDLNPSNQRLIKALQNMKAKR